MIKPVTILQLLLIIIIVAIMGCDLGSERVEKTQKAKKSDVAFVDSSEGLPMSGRWRHGLGFYDMNDDGYVDILATPPRKASAADKEPVVWYGSKENTWKKGSIKVPSGILYDYGSIAGGDFDGDNIADIALAMHSQDLRFLKGAGKGEYVDFSEGLPLSKEFKSRAVVSGDFDNDGVKEVAAVSEAPFRDPRARPNGLWVFNFQGSRWESSPALKGNGAEGLYADQLVIGDMNGDGNKDIAIASLVQHRNLIIWVGDGKGGFTPFNKGLVKEQTYMSVAFGDIDMDGKDDLIASITGFGPKGFMGLKAFLSGSDGFEQISEGLPENELFTAICAGDLDKSGAVEVVGVTAEGGIKIFRYSGNRWGQVPVQGLPESGLTRTYGIYCMDINNDGYKDLVLNYALGADLDDSGGIRVFLNRAGNSAGPGNK